MNRQDLAEPVRRQLKRLPPPHDAHYGVVPAAPPEGPIQLSAEAPRKLDEATAAMARADAIASLLPSHFLLSRILVRQEAVSSSAIEDTHSTLDDVLLAEETEADAEDGEPREAARQVRDYAVALEEALHDVAERHHDAFSSDLFCRLHRSVMASDSSHRGVLGEVRRVVNWIGGSNIARSTFNPPPPDDVHSCLDDQVAYLRCLGQQAMTQHIVTRMAIAHAHFEAIHPFSDGNGRVGRLLLPLMMAADGKTPLYLSPFIAREKDRYYRALRLAQQRLDYEPLIVFLAEAVATTADEAEDDRKKLDDLMMSWTQRRAFRKGSAALKMLGLLPGYPIVSVGRLAKELGVTFAAANRAVDQLQKAGILKLRATRRRNRVFAAVEVLAIYNRR